MFSTKDAEQTREPFGLIPPGLYRVVISELSLKTTKAGTGDYFEFVLGVVAPQGFSGKVWYITTFNNPNPAATSIGRSQLADFLFVLQVDGFESVSELQQKIVGKELLVELGVEAGYDGRERSKVEVVYSVGGKHRNESRSLKAVALGPNGKAATQGKASQGVSAPKKSSSESQDVDVPF